MNILKQVLILLYSSLHGHFVCEKIVKERKEDSFANEKEMIIWQKVQ